MPLLPPGWRCVKEDYVPIVATRLVNPPGRRRKSKRYPKYTLRSNPKRKASSAVRTIRTPGGIRYLKGGKFISAARAKASRARRNATSFTATANPRRRTRRNQAAAALKERLAAARAAGFDVGGAAEKARKKAARLQKAKAAPKRRKKTTTKRRKTVAKKRRTPPRTKTGRFRKRRSAKKTTRKRTTKRRTRRNPVNANPRRRTRRRRNPISMNPGTRRRRRSTRRRRNPMIEVKRGKTGKLVGYELLRTKHSKSGQKFRARYTRKTKSGRRKWAPRFTPMRNPLNTLKSALPIYGGILAIRVATTLIKKYAGKYLGEPATAAAKYGPAGIAFLFATLVAPKIKPLARNTKLLEGMKLGATIALGDVLIRELVQPALRDSKNETLQAIGAGLAGYDDLGVQGYGYGEFIADPRGYSLPPAHQTMEPGVGLDATEAMALDEYVSDVGYNVNEALAGSEGDYIQRGGAGGSLSKTVFSS